MYQHAKALGITLITISLRYDPAALCFTYSFQLTQFFSPSPSLAKYHTHLLTLQTEGILESDSDNSFVNWTLTRVGTAAERMERDREIAHLEAKLAEVGEWEDRVKELDRLLSSPMPL